MNRMARALFCAAILGGCATVVKGTTQQIAINTRGSPAPPAR